ncbi:MAG: pilus assembly PilX N-terminal domain-containing protein [Patescibacteria group bacterium]|nr:pilus assembly PilX N-terminal domain-containing protein [Patescibacteria group bacterium]
MRNKNKNQSGIALITTIILTSIMLSSMVLITKEMTDEARNSIRIDNSMIAYYAAEAGVEDALLEFRYDHSAEISKENDANPAIVDVACTPPDNFNCTPRTVNLSTNARDYNAKSFNTSYYDVLMWNRVKSILNQKILRDDTAEFVVPNMVDNVILDWSWDSEIDTQNSGFRVEITVYNEDGSMVPIEKDGKKFTDPSTKSIKLYSSLLGSGKKIIRIKPAYVDKGSYDPITESYSEGKSLPSGITPSINLNINQTPNSNFIAGTITKIESVGYYGGVARKISATVDRPSGNILNIFDYVIYSGGDLIK